MREKEIKEAFYKRGRLYAKRIKTGVVYGPIISRRSKISLGISPVKGGFFCNFNCIYCQYGREANKKGKFATPAEIKKELEKRLRSFIKKKKRIDSLTICGPTEPLLNPKIMEIIDIVIKLRDKYFPKAKVDLYTNVFRIVDFRGIDEVFLKFDADFTSVRRPIDKTTKEKVIKNIIKANSKPKIIQSIWFKGKKGNVTKRAFSDYVKSIKKINKKNHIDFIQVYTLLYIPPETDIFPCEEKELRKLAKEITKKTGVKSKVYFRPTKLGMKFKF